MYTRYCSSMNYLFDSLAEVRRRVVDDRLAEIEWDGLCQPANWKLRKTIAIGPHSISLPDGRDNSSIRYLGTYLAVRSVPILYLV